MKKMLPWILCGILLAVILLLGLKIVLLRKAMEEIARDLREHLSLDTNTLLSVSSNDRAVNKLAAELNGQLRLLRKERRRFQNGDRELKTAVTNISHDLRTPLTAICGYLTLLEQEKKSEAVTRYLAVIQSRVDTMKNLTEELFRYSVILADQQTLPLESVSLNRALEESLAAYYGALTARGITPEITMPEERLRAPLNKNALARILGNILTNAIKYSDGDLQVRLSEDGEFLFSNRASQLDEAQVGRLFDRFYTVESAAKSTGLGLSIAKVLTEQMNGKISAEYKNKTLLIRLKFQSI